MDNKKPFDVAKSKHTAKTMGDQESTCMDCGRLAPCDARS